MPKSLSGRSKPLKKKEELSDFEFNGKRYWYTGKCHYQCEFCQDRATWNAVVKADSRYSFVCDRHFLEHCDQEASSGSNSKAARIPDPYPDESYTLTTIEELHQQIENLRSSK